MISAEGRMSGIMSLPRALLQPSTGHYRAPQPCTSGPPASRGDPQASPPFACGDHVRSGPAPVCTLCIKRCSSASAFRGGNEKAEAGASLLPSHARLTLTVLQTTAELEKSDYPPKTEANPCFMLVVAGWGCMTPSLPPPGKAAPGHPWVLLATGCSEPGCPSSAQSPSCFSSPRENQCILKCQ